MPKDQGYYLVKQLLQSTFGQQFQNVRACSDFLINGLTPHQTDKVAMLKCSAELNSCFDTLTGMNYFHKIDNFDVLSKIARRLPQFYLSRWQEEVDSIEHVKKDEVSIEHLAELISSRTRQMPNL